MGLSSNRKFILVTIVIGLFNLAIPVLLQNYFSPAHVVEFTKLLSFSTVAAALFTLQLHQGYVRYFFTESEPHLLSTIIFITTILWLIITVVYFTGTFSMFDQFYPLLPFGGFALASFYFFQHRYRMQQNAILYLIYTLLPKTLVLVLVYFGSIKVSSGFLIAYIICLFPILSLRNWLRTDEIFSLSKKLLVYSSPLVPAFFMFSIIQTFDRIFASRLFEPEQFSVYAVASLLAGSAGLTANLFTVIWSRSIVQCFNHSTFGAFTKNGVFLCGVVVSVLWLCAIIVAPLIFSLLFPGDFDLDMLVGLFVILLGFYFFNIGSEIINSMFGLYNNTRYILISNFLTLIILLIVYLLYIYTGSLNLYSLAILHSGISLFSFIVRFVILYFRGHASHLNQPLILLCLIFTIIFLIAIFQSHINQLVLLFCLVSIIVILKKQILSSAKHFEKDLKL